MAALLELLALTGQRRQEVCKLKWDEIDEKTRTWSIRASRTKNKRAHAVQFIVGHDVNERIDSRETACGAQMQGRPG